MYTKKSIAGIIASLAIGIVAVYAASVHFKNGPPQFTDNGTTLTTCGALAGLGNEDVTITVSARRSGSTLCINPGGNAAPGQNKVAVSTSVSQTIDASKIKNGNVSFCQTTPAPGPVTGKEAGCPNDNWVAPIDDVEFSSATVTVVQGGQVVLEQTFTF